MSKEFIYGWGFIFLAALLDCFTIFVVKWRALIVGRFEFETISQSCEYLLHYFNHPLVWVAMITFLMGPFFGYIALTRLELTVAYPVSITLHIIFTFSLGFFLLHEPMHLYKLIGIILMAGGLYFFFRS